MQAYAGGGQLSSSLWRRGGEGERGGGEDREGGRSGERRREEWREKEGGGEGGRRGRRREERKEGWDATISHMTTGTVQENLNMMLHGAD